MNNSKNIKVLHLIVSGSIGGIEKLMNEYANFSELNNVFVFAFKGGINSEQMINNKHNVIVLNGKNKSLLYLYRQINKICKKEKINIMVTHNSSVKLKTIALVLKRKYQFKLVTFAHSAIEDILFIHDKHYFIKSFLAKINMLQCDKIIAVSNYIKNGITTKLKINDKKIKVIYCGIDINNISSNLKNSKIKNIVYIGRLTREKGVENTIKALQLTDHSKYSLTIVGDGEYRNQLENLSSSSKNISFVGSSIDINKYLNLADTFIHVPNWNEACPLSLLEALASGLLCIVSKKGSLHELIIDKYNGFLIDDSDPYILKEKIEEINLKYNEQDLLEIKKNAIEHSKNFSIVAFTKNLDNTLINEI